MGLKYVYCRASQDTLIYCKSKEHLKRIREPTKDTIASLKQMHAYHYPDDGNQRSLKKI